MTRTALRFGAPLALALSSMLFPACSAKSLQDAAAQGDCSASASGAAFVQAEADLEAAVARISGEVGLSCYNIAKAGGMAPSSWDGAGVPNDDQVKASCDAASAVIGMAQASGSFSLTVTGGECHADVSASADCTAKCSGDASCSGGDLSVQCEPGKFEASCSGMCAANAACDWDGTSPVDCQGSCDGSCQGMIMGGCEGSCMGDCMGTCSAMDAMGKCAGKCSGMCSGTCTKPAASATCNGKCSGACKLTNPVMCSGSAKCQGTCMGTAMAPTCKGQVTPPMCSAKADCSGSCQAHAQANAVCTPPKVVIVSSFDATVIAALSAELPKIFLVAQIEGKNLVALIGNVTGGIKAAVSGSAACALKLSGFVKASASINVNVQASASVSGKASGGSM